MRKNGIVSAVILLMSVGVIGCGKVHTHTLTVATCTTPATCTECGEQVGLPTNHTYSEATCIAPATCSVCGATSGNVIGHTVEFGKCGVCGVFQGKEIIDSIAAEYDLIFNKSEVLSSKLAYSSDYYSSFSSMASGYSALEKNYQNMIDLCGNYSELSSLKSACRDAKKALPTNVGGSSQKDLEKYLDDFEAYVYEECNVGLELDSVKKKSK